MKEIVIDPGYAAARVPPDSGERSTDYPYGNILMLNVADASDAQYMVVHLNTMYSIAGGYMLPLYTLKDARMYVERICSNCVCNPSYGDEAIVFDRNGNVEVAYRYCYVDELRSEWRRIA